MTPTPDPRRFSFYLAAPRDLGAALAETPGKVASAGSLRDSLMRVMGSFAIGRGALLLWNEDKGSLATAATKGLGRGRKLEIALDKRQVRALAASTRPFHPHMPPGGLETFAEALRTALEKTGLVLVAPLGTGSALVGVLLLGPCVSRKPLSVLELEVLEEMGAVLALRVEETRARRQLDAKVRQLQRVNNQLRRIYLETVRAMAGVIDGPQPDGKPSHSLRVAALATEMGRRLKLPADRRTRLYLAGLLHDIGKQIIGREVLGQSEPLSSDQRREIEHHPEMGCELISHVRFPWGDIAEVIRHHHERLDGQGYPDRLRGSQISIEARILMMAEAFDAMTSDQPWRPRLPMDQIVTQIHENLGLQFEPEVAQALCDVVEAGLDGEVKDSDFVPHLESSFDPALIRKMMTELRKQLANPTLRPPADIIDMTQGET